MPSPFQKPLEDPQEEIFAREYSRHGNRQRAIVSARFNVKTWEEHGSRSADVKASNLLKKDSIRQRIQWLQENRARKADFTELKLLRELRRIALFDIRKLYDKDGGLKKPTEWDDETAAGVSAIDVEKLFGDDGTGKKGHIGYTVKVKTADKIAAIDKLMRYFGMLTAPGETGSTTVNVENQQVNFYLPENPRHAKKLNGATDQLPAEEGVSAQPAEERIQLPAKQSNGTNGSH